MKKFYAGVCKSEVYVAAFCFTASCIIIFTAAITRTFGMPINWSLDVSLFLFAWSVFLSADAAMRADKLVNVDMLVNKLPEKWRTLINIINYCIILIFLGALLVYGIKLSYTTRSRSFQGIPGFSYTWVTLAVPLGAALQIVTVIIKIRDLVRRGGV